jgi:hypothetical protein
MSNTPPSVSSQSGSTPNLAAPSAQPRTSTDNGRQSALFQRELDRLSKPDPKKDGEGSEASEATTKRSAKGSIDEREGRENNEDRGGRHFADLPSDAMTSALFRAAKVSASQAPSAPELPAEHLARIAAAIQELVANGATANYQLQLPLGNAMVQGAVLGRDASGNLAIQLIASGSVSPQHAAQLRSELIRRMERKRLKIASLEVSTGQADGGRLPQKRRPA